MKTNSSQPPTNKRFVIKRKRRGLYHVTDTLKCVEYRTRDPKPFRPSQQIVLTPHPRKEEEVDLGQLARLLIEIARQQDK